MPWLSRREYQDLLKRMDDRDMAQVLRELEGVRKALMGLRTFVQRRLDAAPDDDQDVDDDQDAVVVPVPGGWGRKK